MTKNQAVKLFGTQAELARSLGVTRAYISKWPNELPTKLTDWTVGAAFRLGKPIPDRYRGKMQAGR